MLIFHFLLDYDHNHQCYIDERHTVAEVHHANALAASCAKTVHTRVHMQEKK